MKKFALFMLLVSAGSLFAQENLRTLRGRVTDEDGEPLIGATVRVVDGSGGTSTNVNGEFLLNASV